ncbi:hypothetical protein CKO21_02170 [Rhodovibrio salinarum]|uniref:Uncharacterized protein n=2 Tax=Rhodovibrio salinarum TaxID=1087 RepID=A0A934QGD7_9PROT|nr:hypothetical protein [Rhodovibrio salinarum]
MGDVDAAIEAARRIVDFVAEDEEAPASPLSKTVSSANGRPKVVMTETAPRPAGPTRRQTTHHETPVASKAASGAAGEAGGRADPGAAAVRPSSQEARGGTGVGRGAGPKTRWDEGAEEVLRAEWGTGRPVEEIAAKIGRTVGSTRERARRLGLSRPKRSEVAPEYRPQPANRPVAAKGGGADVRTLHTKTKRKGRRRPRHADVRRVEPIDISAYRIQRPSETIDSVVNFVRSRDYQVVRAADGTFVVDGRKEFTEAAFIEWANGLRRMLKKPAFALECAQGT